MLPRRLTRVNRRLPDEPIGGHGVSFATTGATTRLRLYHRKVTMSKTTRLATGLGLAAAVITFSSACHAVRASYPIDQVVAQSRQGVAAASIIGDIKAGKTSYALRGSDFGRLKAAGVQDEVLDYLQRSFIGDIDLLTRYWVLGESLGKCAPCYPQEVDLSGLASSGKATQSPPPLQYRPVQPLGVPSWHQPWNAGFGGRTFKIAALRDMARQGRSEAEMLALMKNGAPDRVVGVGGIGQFGTRPLPGISGPELAQLHADGVPDKVLDELQARFLSAYVENARLRYQNYGKGSRP